MATRTRGNEQLNKTAHCDSPKRVSVHVELREKLIVLRKCPNSLLLTREQSSLVCFQPSTSGRSRRAVRSKMCLASRGDSEPAVLQVRYDFSNFFVCGALLSCKGYVSETAMWQRAVTTPKIPSPVGNGWKLNND